MTGARRARRLAIGVALLGCLASACGASPDQPSESAAATPSVSRAPSVTPSPTASRTAPSATPSPSATPTAADTLTVVAGGDVLLHESTWSQADHDAGGPDDGVLDFAPMMAALQPVVAAADLALCHLETPLAPPGGPYHGYPAFSVPPQIVPALVATGFDACSGASNHTFDQGLDGVTRTAAEMRAGGLPTYGTGVDGRPPNPTVVTVGDVPVGLLSYAYGSNAAVPAPGVVEQLDPADIAADARQARAEGAQIVIASLHWGTEYDHEPNAQQREVAAAVAAIPEVDLVIGHHAHVVQPIERVGSTWVAFGLGNMLATQSTAVPANHEGVLAEFTFTRQGDEWQVTGAAYLPIFIDRETEVRVIPLGQPGDPSTRHAEALARTRQFVRDGSSSDGLVELPAR